MSNPIMYIVRIVMFSVLCGMIFLVLTLGTKIQFDDGPIKSAIYMQRFQNAFITDGTLNTSQADTQAFTNAMGSQAMNTKFFGIRVIFLDPTTKKAMDIDPVFFNQERFEQYAPASMEASIANSGFYKRLTTYRVVYLIEEKQSAVLKMEMIYK